MNIDRASDPALDINKLRRKAEHALSLRHPFVSVNPADLLALIDALGLLRERRAAAANKAGR